MTLCSEEGTGSEEGNSGPRGLLCAGGLRMDMAPHASLGQEKREQQNQSCPHLFWWDPLLPSEPTNNPNTTWPRDRRGCHASICSPGLASLLQEKPTVPKPGVRNALLIDLSSICIRQSRMAGEGPVGAGTLGLFMRRPASETGIAGCRRVGWGFRKKGRLLGSA